MIVNIGKKTLLVKLGQVWEYKSVFPEDGSIRHLLIKKINGTAEILYYNILNENGIEDYIDDVTITIKGFVGIMKDLNGEVIFTE